MKPHPHAPWRSAFGDFKAPGRASAKPAAGRAAMPSEASSPLRVVAPSAPSRWPLQPLHLASSSHRGRIAPRAVPRSLPGAGRNPRPQAPTLTQPLAYLRTGRPVWVMGEGIVREVLGAGISLPLPSWSPLWRPSTSLPGTTTGRAALCGPGLPCASQGVDARDKPEHDGGGNRDASCLPGWEKVARSAG